MLRPISIARALILLMLTANYFEFSPVAMSAPPSVLSIFRASSAAEQISDTELELKAEHGPWLILATSLEGSDSQKQAQDLARELRQKYRLNAYVLPKQFDYSQTVVGSGVASDGRQRHMKHLNNQKIDVYGVLVGDFDSLDSPKIKETLLKIKKIVPQSLASDKENPKRSEETVAAYKRWLRLNSESHESKLNGPLAGAFVTRNPLLPEDYFQSPKVDKFVRSLNSDFDHSLLESKGRFTVRVATFKGGDTVVLKDTRAAQLAASNPTSEALDRAAIQANLAVKVLRQAGYDAYQFHDRNMSVVTVGSFDSLGSENAQGQFVYASEIRQVIQEFGGAKEYRGSQMGPLPVAKTLLDIVPPKKIPELMAGSESERTSKVIKHSIPFDLEPKAMAIPKVETNRLYNGSLLGKN